MEQLNETLPQYTSRPRAIAFAPGTGTDPRLPPAAVIPPTSSSPPPPASPSPAHEQPPASLLNRSAPSTTSSDTLTSDDMPHSPRTTSPSAGRDIDGHEDEESEKRDVEDTPSEPQLPPALKHQPSQTSTSSSLPARPPPVYSPSADTNV